MFIEWEKFACAENHTVFGFRYPSTFLFSQSVVLHDSSLYSYIYTLGTGAAATSSAEQPAANKTGKYIAPGLREGAANRRGETMPRSQRGTLLFSS